MNLEHKHLQEQRQTIKMTQELSQAIAVLQYTKEELTAYLEDKALENPFLDIVVDQKSVLDKNRFKETYKEQYKNTSDDYDVIGQLPEKTKNLAQFLHEQVMLSMREMKLRDIVQFLVDNLDENGYLKFTYQELGDSIDATEVEFENGLTLLQQLDPAGIGARSLSECICLQIDRDIRAPKSAFRIIQNHFEEFSQKKWQKIAISENISLQEIEKIADYIKTLTPYPGKRFNEETNLYISPDVRVTRVADAWQIIPINSGIPEVQFNTSYFDSMKAETESEVQQYLQQKQADYHWIKQVLDKRISTITAVTEAILQRQHSFFNEEHHPLQPMTFMDVAKEIDVHESTISRTVNNKYLETSFGIYELRSFFTQGVSENNISNKTVQELIKVIIAEEDTKKPLSDQKITDLLKKSDIVISRRTVAKYRTQLHIGSAQQRKRF